MTSIVILFTRRQWNPVSWAIRWAMPRSRFAWALSSHAIIAVGDIYYEATMIHGVRKGTADIVLAGQQVVRSVVHAVPDVAAGVVWAEAQLCQFRPTAPAWLPKFLRPAYCMLQMVLHSNYDWKGAFGLGLAPDRNWADEADWFCYEFVAGFLRAAGRPLFANLSHVGETALLAINPIQH